MNYSDGVPDRKPLNLCTSAGIFKIKAHLSTCGSYSVCALVNRYLSSSNSSITTLSGTKTDSSPSSGDQYRSLRATLSSYATSTTRPGSPSSSRAPTSCSGHSVSLMTTLKAWLLRTGFNGPNQSSSNRSNVCYRLPPPRSHPAIRWTISAKPIFRLDRYSDDTWTLKWARKTPVPSDCSKATRAWRTSLSASGLVSAPALKIGHCRRLATVISRPPV